MEQEEIFTVYPNDSYIVPIVGVRDKQRVVPCFQIPKSKVQIMEEAPFI